jgi:hydrogenase maturation factor
MAMSTRTSSRVTADFGTTVTHDPTEGGVAAGLHALGIVAGKQMDGQISR